jgi:D-glycerate 3-kinase
VGQRGALGRARGARRAAHGALAVTALRHPLADLIAAAAGRGEGGRPALIGLAGAQGSGKSTLAAAFAAGRPDAAVFSLDDFYLDAAARARLAEMVHPLLGTRGVPGTHDLDLLEATIASLRSAGPDDVTPIPVFDKLGDDRVPRDQWRMFLGRPGVILVEGWCLGATPQDEAELATPVNALEREADGDGRWRRWVNAQLAGPYAAFFARFDAIAFLRAPDMARVVRWRSEQQQGLLARPLSKGEEAEIAGFVAHFERITQHMIAGGVRAELVMELAADRSVLT